jgi:hypothetical protein
MKNSLLRKPRTSRPSKDGIRSRTKLGGTLRRIRDEIVASGAALLDWDALDREVTERRGDKNGDTRR